MTVRFGKILYRVKSIIEYTLVVDVIIGTEFLNSHVIAIKCCEQKIQLRTAVLPIVQKHHGRSADVGLPDLSHKWTEVRTRQAEIEKWQSEIAYKEEMGIALVRTSREITLPPYSQTKASVFSSPDGLVYLEPNGDLAATDDVRMANGMAEVSAERPFELFLSNFSKLDRWLPKVMLCSHAIMTHSRTRSPINLLHVERISADS